MKCITVLDRHILTTQQLEPKIPHNGGVIVQQVLTTEQEEERIPRNEVILRSK